MRLFNCGTCGRMPKYLEIRWNYFCNHQTDHNDQIKSLTSFKLTWQPFILCLVCYRREFWEKTITWMLKWFVRGVLIFMYISHINAHNRMDAGVCCAHCVWYDRNSPQLPDTNDIFTLLSVHFCVCVSVCMCWFYGKPGPHESWGGYPCSKLKLTFFTSTRPSRRMDSGRQAHTRAWYHTHYKLPDPI